MARQSTRRQAAAKRHTCAADRHVGAVARLLPPPVQHAAPKKRTPPENAHISHPKQKLDDTDHVLVAARRRAKRQSIVVSSRSRRRAARRVVAEQQRAKFALTRKMERREERSSLRLARKKLIRSRVVKQIRGRHSTGVTRHGKKAASISKVAVKSAHARKASKARHVRLLDFSS